MRKLELYMVLGMVLLVGVPAGGITVDVAGSQGEAAGAVPDGYVVVASSDEYIMVVSQGSEFQSGAGPLGDLDGDGKVGQSDLDIVLGGWGDSAPLDDPRADVQVDGFVGQGDLDMVLGDWGEQAPPAHMPEPLTVLAVGMGIGALGGYIRRRRRA